MVKIVTLLDNISYKREVAAEHGLSFYIETEGCRTLFDTGQSDLCIKNAQKLGIDLSKVDNVVVSHGHYDHTGGLDSFLNINRVATVYIGKDAILPRFHKGKSVGIPQNLSIPNNRLFLTNPGNIYPLSDNLYVVSAVEDKVHYSNMDDCFNDEQYLVYRGKDGIYIVTGCSHKGIQRITDMLKERFSLPVAGVFGGIHTMEADEEGVDKITAYFNSIKPLFLGLNHCTGIEAYFRIKSEVNAKVIYMSTGNVFEDKSN